MKFHLYEKQVALGAKMVDFAGFEMPLQYAGIIEEVRAVREVAGLFDVSHMGRISVRGERSEEFLDYLSTNKICGKKELTATYTVLSNRQGGAVDDVLIYKISPTHFFMIVNASNREKVLAHLKKYLWKGIVIEDHFKEGGILALQGPKATLFAEKIFPEVKPMHFKVSFFGGEEVIVSGTGYTGAGGLEFYGNLKNITALWDRLLLEEGLKPAGLGARDLLRLEKGYALYGHELREDIAPNESVSSWTIKWDGRDFLGKSAMEILEKSSTKRKQYGLILEEPGIAREGYPVLKNGVKVGLVTSGNFSPTLKKSIAIVMISGTFQETDRIEVIIREKKVKAKETPLPFL